MIHVTIHAIERYRERVAAVTEDEARAILSSRAFIAAVDFGAEYVRLPSGHRAVINEGNVVTILPCNKRHKNYPRWRETDA